MASLPITKKRKYISINKDTYHITKDTSCEPPFKRRKLIPNSIVPNENKPTAYSTFMVHATNIDHNRNNNAVLYNNPHKSLDILLHDDQISYNNKPVDRLSKYNQHILNRNISSNMTSIPYQPTYNIINRTISETPLPMVNLMNNLHQFQMIKQNSSRHIHNSSVSSFRNNIKTNNLCENNNNHNDILLSKQYNHHIPIDPVPSTTKATYINITADLPNDLKCYFTPKNINHKKKQHSTKIFGIKYNSTLNDMNVQTTKWVWGFKWQCGKHSLMFGKLKDARLYTKKVIKYSNCDYVCSGISISIIRNYYNMGKPTGNHQWGKFPLELTTTPSKTFQMIHDLVWKKNITFDKFKEDYGWISNNGTHLRTFQQQKDLYDKKVELKYAKKEYRKLKKNIRKIPWANKALDHIDARLKQEHTRTIELIVGRNGNEGKSKLAEYLEARGAIKPKKKAQIITKTNPHDIAMAWDPSAKIVIFDLPMRHKIKSTDGEIFEAIKNGRVTQTKYRSKSKRTLGYMKPVVAIFANEYPSGDMYKPDRYIDSCFEIINNDLVPLDPCTLEQFPKNYKPT